MKEDEKRGGERGKERGRGAEGKEERRRRTKGTCRDTRRKNDVVLKQNIKIWDIKGPIVPIFFDVN